MAVYLAQVSQLLQMLLWLVRGRKTGNYLGQVIPALRIHCSLLTLIPEISLHVTKCCLKAADNLQDQSPGKDCQCECANINATVTHCDLMVVPQRSMDLGDHGRNPERGGTTPVCAFFVHCNWTVFAFDIKFFPLHSDYFFCRVCWVFPPLLSVLTASSVDQK